MNEKQVTLYSSLLRLMLIAFIIAFPLFNNPHGFNTSLVQNSFILSMILLTFCINIIGQVINKFKIPFYITSLLLSASLYFIYDKIIILMVVLGVLDLLVLFKLNPFYGLGLIVLYSYSGQYLVLFLLFTVLMIFLYFFIYSIIEEQRTYIETRVKMERQLLNQLNLADKARKSELNRTILRFENQRLKEKSELSQNLHDKIGHAINGSIFKLEGAKLLIYKDTAKSHDMVDDVITALRSSVDEIRLLLRNEKPSTEIMNINKLQTLYIDFTDKYDIETNFKVEGDTSKIPPDYFSILFDNTIEALSNSLKYAKCTKIDASLLIYNKILRYTIHDNGIGADHYTENMGLTGIKDRIASIDGMLIISSEYGFELNMLIPIPETEA